MTREGQSRPFAARYAGRCAACDQSIYEGDWIHMTDNGAIHEQCAQDDDQ